MRAIDYLYTRNEVDKNKIGVTGASGGGSQTIYATILDDRIKVAVPVVYSGIMQLGAGYGCICETIPNLFPDITPSILRSCLPEESSIHKRMGRHGNRFNPADLRVLWD